MALSPYVNMSRDALIQHLMHKDEQVDNMIDTINTLKNRVKHREGQMQIMKSELARLYMRDAVVVQEADTSA